MWTGKTCRITWTRIASNEILERAAHTWVDWVGNADEAANCNAFWWGPHGFSRIRLVSPVRHYGQTNFVHEYIFFSKIYKEGIVFVGFGGHAQECGLLLAKAAALRVTLNLDGTPIASNSHTHPSHSQTSRLLTSSLSLGVRKTNPVGSPPHSLMYKGVSVITPQTDRVCPSPWDWRIQVCMTTEIEFLIPLSYPSLLISFTSDQVSFLQSDH